MTQKWQALLKKLKIIEGYGQDICSGAGLAQFEGSSNIELPEDYKNYCKLLGTGQFGNWITIRCPDTRSSLVQVWTLKKALERKIESDSYLENLDSIERLLNSAFVFGGTATSEIIFWDLASSNESDNSYDIYFSSSAEFEIHRVGRDFFEFIQNFCLGTELHSLIPDWLRPSSEDICYTFTRGPQLEVPPNVEDILRNMDDFSTD